MAITGVPSTDWALYINENKITCNLTGSTYNGSFPLSVTTTLCDSVKTPGPDDDSIDFDGLLDAESGAASLQALWALKAAKTRATFKFGPEGEAQGDLMISGYGYLNDFSFAVTPDGVTASGTFGVDGTPATTTWP